MIYTNLLEKFRPDHHLGDFLRNNWEIDKCYQRLSQYENALRHFQNVKEHINKFHIENNEFKTIDDII